MRIYQVGGSVRDRLLGLKCNDYDFVVVGSTPDKMKNMGFIQVGSSFPVFLHPTTRDEFALARTELSNGDSHTDFDIEWEGVTLEDDLSRRDLTINAIAMDSDNNLVDPYNGQHDLLAGILRHISDSFAEDPLRVLRVARFASQLEFTVAPETLEMMRSIVSKGMLSTISAERLWKETEKALLCKKPSLYFEVLDEVGALAILFPELKALDGIPQRENYHAEGDVWVHTRMVIDEAARLTSDLPKDKKIKVMAAALFHDLGKAHTPKELLWAEDGSPIGRHHGHEDPDRFSASLKAVSSRLKIPSKISQFSFVVAKQHQRIHNIRKLSARKLVNLFEEIRGGFNKAEVREMSELIALACEADSEGRLILSQEGKKVKSPPYSQGHYFTKLIDCLVSVPEADLFKSGLEEGKQIEHIKNAVRQRRVHAAKSFLKEYQVDLLPTER